MFYYADIYFNDPNVFVGKISKNREYQARLHQDYIENELEAFVTDEHPNGITLKGSLDNITFEISVFGRENVDLNKATENCLGSIIFYNTDKTEIDNAIVNEWIQKLSLKYSVFIGWYEEDSGIIRVYDNGDFYKSYEDDMDYYIACESRFIMDKEFVETLKGDYIRLNVLKRITDIGKNKKK